MHSPRDGRGGTVLVARWETGVCQLGRDRPQRWERYDSQQQGHAESYRTSVGVARPTDRGFPYVLVAEADHACDVCLAASGHGDEEHGRRVGDWFSATNMPLSPYKL